MRIFKDILFVVLGIALVIGIFCVTVAIGCAINGISFTEQIAQWFGSSTNAKEVTSGLEQIILKL